MVCKATHAIRSCVLVEQTQAKSNTSHNCRDCTMISSTDCLGSSLRLLHRPPPQLTGASIVCYLILILIPNQRVALLTSINSGCAIATLAVLDAEVQCVGVRVLCKREHSSIFTLCCVERTMPRSAKAETAAVTVAIRVRPIKKNVRMPLSKPQPRHTVCMVKKNVNC